MNGYEDGYDAAVADMRWLAAARDMYTGDEVQFQARTVRQVADIASGTNDGSGWLPSWLWEAWEARKRHSHAPSHNEAAHAVLPGELQNELRGWGFGDRRDSSHRVTEDGAELYLDTTENGEYLLASSDYGTEECDDVRPFLAVVLDVLRWATPTAKRSKESPRTEEPAS